eukprot:1916192-Lingulodinium_polyedra.AAC.1
MEVARDRDDKDVEPGGDDKGFEGLPPATTAVPPCPAVALYGRVMIHSTLTASWRRWAGGTSERCPVKEELRKI